MERIQSTRTVAGIQARNLTLVCDSQDTDAIREQLGDVASGYDSFFVGDTERGEYGEVWGMCGKVPYMSKLVTRLI